MPLKLTFIRWFYWRELLGKELSTGNIPIWQCGTINYKPVFYLPPTINNLNSRWYLPFPDCCLAVRITLFDYYSWLPNRLSSCRSIFFINKSNWENRSRGRNFWLPKEIGRNRIRVSFNLVQTQPFLFPVNEKYGTYPGVPVPQGTSLFQYNSKPFISLLTVNYYVMTVSQRLPKFMQFIL